jgi:hypothetical protein
MKTIEEQKSSIQELKKQVDHHKHRFNRMNDKFENSHIRMGLLESAVVNGKSSRRRRRHRVISSDEEYGKFYYKCYII